MRIWLATIVLLGVSFVAERLLAADSLTVERTSDGVAVKIGGKPFTNYLVKSGAKPVLYPIIGPTGQAMTRKYPIEHAAGEDEDHIHQRSLWFTHGKVNGIDFWSELEGHGTTEHRGFDEVTSDGKRARIVTRNDWLGPKGDKQCEDRRTVAFEAHSDWRLIDFEIVLKAAPGPVTFGDTKEGSFGLRMAPGLTVQSRAGKKLGGKIVTSDGYTDAEAWGKRVPWVDYHGSIDGQAQGIAVLNHPTSFRYPTFWHVRPYGLFAANPFGSHDFVGGKDGSHTLKPGQSLTLRYRVVLHKGDEKAADIDSHFKRYEATSKF